MNHGIHELVERRERGVIRHASSVYGTSVEGIPLTVYLPDSGTAKIVILAAIHGDEAETTVVVSEALRCLSRGDLRAAAILCGNPDGLQRGTRGNARGVDLNRNFPTSNWSPDPVCYKSRASDARHRAEPRPQTCLGARDDGPPRIARPAEATRSRHPPFRAGVCR
jgi:protein MpaA